MNRRFITATTILTYLKIFSRHEWSENYPKKGAEELINTLNAQRNAYNAENKIKENDPRITGLVCEDIIFSKIKEMQGHENIEKAEQYHKKIPDSMLSLGAPKYLYTATPDLVDSRNKTIYEVKSIIAKQAYGLGKMPNNHFYQVQWQMFISGAHRCYYVRALVQNSSSAAPPVVFLDKQCFDLVEPDTVAFERFREMIEWIELISKNENGGSIWNKLVKA